MSIRHLYQNIRRLEKRILLTLYKNQYIIAIYQTRKGINMKKPKTSEAQRRAVETYEKKFERVNVRLPLGTKEQITQTGATSINSYIVESVQEKLSRDNKINLTNYDFNNKIDMHIYTDKYAVCRTDSTQKKKHPCECFYYYLTLNCRIFYTLVGVSFYN